ncbi:MAG TPA: nuclear transport factor 2 family protein [Nocardioides sp.]|nr:nuclear transport factor 2 family protein [Nocardioides sp.]
MSEQRAEQRSEQPSQQPVVDRFLEAVRLAGIEGCADVWSPDCTLDATVPNWRFHRTGPDRIRETYRAWFADPGAFEELRRSPVDGGEVVAYLLTWTEDGVPHAAHHVHWLDVVDDRIVADVVVCGGRWPAGLLAEMEAADA